VVALAALLVAAGLAACSEGEERPEQRVQPPTREETPTIGEAPATGDPGPVHVHALGVNPADGALFIATHTGLFRERRPGAKPTRVADRWQDTMGFTVIGGDRFLASGHPDGRESLPPFLGLIESRDAGRTWASVSLQGEMDFHVLESAGRRMYGFGSEWKTRNERLLVSDDRGRNWSERPAPEPLADLAIDPRNPNRAVAAGRDSLHLTVDAGRSWRHLPGDTGLLAWTGRGLYKAVREGAIQLARDGLRGWETVGRVAREPAALTTSGDRRLYLALHDGTIWRSNDGGASWRTGMPSRAQGGRSSSPTRDRPTPASRGYKPDRPPGPPVEGQPEMQGVPPPVYAE
jgi:hypothetical protein